MSAVAVSQAGRLCCTNGAFTVREGIDPCISRIWRARLGLCAALDSRRRHRRHTAMPPDHTNLPSDTPPLNTLTYSGGDSNINKQHLKIIHSIKTQTLFIHLGF